MIELDEEQYAQIYQAMERISIERDEARELAQTFYKTLKEMPTNISEISPDTKLPSWLDD